VCDQEYDQETTRRRLLQIVALEAGQGLSEEFVDRVPGLLAKLAKQETSLAASEFNLLEAEQQFRSQNNLRTQITDRLRQLGITFGDKSNHETELDAEIKSTAIRLTEVSEAQAAGEGFALSITRASDQTSIQELEREIAALGTSNDRQEAWIAERVATGEQAQRIIEALRRATSSVVTQRVKEIEPLLREMYARIDVHPAFRIVHILASIVRGRGHLSTILSDPLFNIECDYPGGVLSSSQMNALAVCTFLSLNLGASTPPLEAAILDDPLQSLDDINLLGLVDLLRRTKDHRQLCVSTHDKKFGDLLARKLRPRSAQQRTIVIELDRWDRDGPVVISRDEVADPTPLRLLA